MRVPLPWFFAIVVLGSLADAQDRTAIAPCTFSIRGAAATTPTLVGDQDLIGRFKNLPQADSPVQIEAVDLSKFRVSVSGSSYRQDYGDYGVRLRNRSDAVVTEVRGFVNVVIGSPANSVTGSGWIWRGTLLPDKTVDIVQRSGAATGTVPEGDVFLTATVNSVKVGACTYLPSENEPKR